MFGLFSNNAMPSANTSPYGPHFGMPIQDQIQSLMGALSSRNGGQAPGMFNNNAQWQQGQGFYSSHPATTGPGEFPLAPMRPTSVLGG